MYARPQPVLESSLPTRRGSALTLFTHGATSGLRSTQLTLSLTLGVILLEFCLQSHFPAIHPGLLFLL